MGKNKLKLWCIVLLISALLLIECQSDKQDETDGKEDEEEEEHFETHLWSRLSKDHSSREKRDTSDEEKGITVSACCVKKYQNPILILKYLKCWAGSECRNESSK